MTDRPRRPDPSARATATHATPPRPSAVLALLAAFLLLSGCAGGLEFAAVGAAANAAQTGATVVKRGKINAAQLTSHDRVIHAMKLACVDLGLDVTRYKDNGKGDHRMTAKDPEGGKYKFKVNDRSDRLTLYQIDVGWFGSNAVARLLLRRTQVHLNGTTPDGIKIETPDPTVGSSE